MFVLSKRFDVDQNSKNDNMKKRPKSETKNIKSALKSAR